MITTRHKKKLKKCVEELNKLISEIREYEPEANYYVNGEGDTTINIHTKVWSHTNQKLWFDSIEESEILDYTDCGGY